MDLYHNPATVRDTGAVKMNKTLSPRRGPGGGETDVITHGHSHCALEFVI